MLSRRIKYILTNESSKVLHNYSNGFQKRNRDSIFTPPSTGIRHHWPEQPIKQLSSTKESTSCLWWPGNKQTSGNGLRMDRGILCPFYLAMHHMPLILGLTGGMKSNLGDSYVRTLLFWIPFLIYSNGHYATLAIVLTLSSFGVHWPPISLQLPTKESIAYARYLRSMFFQCQLDHLFHPWSQYSKPSTCVL